MLASLLLAAAVQAAEPPVVRSEAAAERTLTVYRDDLAFVTETHRVALPAGRSRVVLGGVNDQMVPQTATLLAFEGAELERAFTEDLLSKASLFESLLGQKVVMTRTDPATGASEALPVRVLSAENGVVVETAQGVETLDCTGLEATLAAEEVPGGLVAEPELSVLVSREAAGEAVLTLAYLARELSWEADYVLTVGEGRAAGEASLRGWLTIANDTADAFDRVPLAIVAGTLSIDDETEAPGAYAPRYRAACWPRFRRSRIPERTAENPYLLGFVDGRSEIRRFSPEVMAMAAPTVSEEAEFGVDEVVVTGSRVREASEERFGDYRLYRPPAPVTVAPYQVKQVAFLDVDGVGLEKRYVAEVETYPDEEDAIPTEVTYDLDNEAGGALGRALPAGTVRVMTAAGGELYYLGEDDVRDRAVGLPVEVDAGRTTGVRAFAGYEVLSSAELTGGRTRDVVRLTVDVLNDTPEAATAQLRLTEWTEDYFSVEVTRSDVPADPDEPSPSFTVEVPSGGEARFQATLLVTD